jgi:hypothetical protein
MMIHSGLTLKVADGKGTGPESSGQITSLRTDPSMLMNTFELARTMFLC